MLPYPVRSFLLSLLYSLWLPISVMVMFTIRFGFDALLHEEQLFDEHLSIGLFLLPTWLSGLFLTIALQCTHRINKPAAYISGIVLVPASVLLVTFGGLFGPIGIIVYALAASLPAWLVFGIFKLVQHFKKS